MSEQEKYKQMMNEIHVSDTTLRKVMEMDMSKKMLNKKRMMKKMGAVAACRKYHSNKKSTIGTNNVI